MADKDDTPEIDPAAPFRDLETEIYDCLMSVTLAAMGVRDFTDEVPDIVQYAVYESERKLQALNDSFQAAWEKSRAAAGVVR